MSDISHLIDLAKKFRDDRDWKQYHSPKDVAMNISIESGEVLEHFQWRSGRELDEYIAHHKEDISDELSDVLHSVLILCDELDIDVMKAYEAKMKKNEAKYPVEKAKGKNVKHTLL